MPYRLAIPQYVEAVPGIEPGTNGYKALVLPLNYTATKKVACQLTFVVLAGKCA